jgi:hypothetical protein
LSDIVLYLGIGALAASGLAVQLLITHRRHNRDHREDLEPILKDHGLTFVSARWPGWFKVGPFPKFEIEVSRPQSRVGGIRGEYNEYRIVTVQDSQENLHELWANLEFELFRLRRIKWRTENAKNFPSQAKEMLEN